MYTLMQIWINRRLVLYLRLNILIKILNDDEISCELTIMNDKIIGE